MNILQRSMASQGILNDTQTTLADYLMSIAQISVEDAGAIYIELSSIRGNFMANIILRMIENYHFLPDMAQKLKNKQALVESVIANEQLEPSITLSIKDVYDDLVNSKLDMIEGLVPISAIQYDAKLRFESGNAFECNVSSYSVDAIDRAEHTDELVCDGKTHLRIDYKVSGIGSNSCGPELLDQYRLSDKQIGFCFVISPLYKTIE